MNAPLCRDKKASLYAPRIIAVAFLLLIHVSPAMADAAADSENPTADASENDELAEEETIRSLERALTREGGLVLPAKTFEIETAFSYEYQGDNVLQIVTLQGQSQFVLLDSKRHFTKAGLGVRAGVGWAAQLDMSLPYSWRRERRVINGNLEQSINGAGFGNFEIGLTKQIFNESRGSPGLLGGIRWREAGSADEVDDPSATASSFGTIQGVLTAVKRIDPLVLFGSLSHAVNQSRRINGTTVDPGNSTGINLGSILALTPDVSMRFRFQFSRSQETRLDGVKSAGTDAVFGMFNTGFSFLITPRTLLSLEAGIGLTPTSPDFRIELTIPVRF